MGYDSDTLRQQGAVGGKEISNKYMLCAAVGLLARLCKVRWSPVGVAVEFAAGDRGGTRLCATGREVSGKTRTPCLQGAIGGKKISNLYKHNAAVGNLSG